MPSKVGEMPLWKGLAQESVHSFKDISERFLQKRKFLPKYACIPRLDVLEDRHASG
jgi:hypothetical protein